MSNWFKKLGFGLKKSSDKLNSGLSTIFGNSKLSENYLEELEELFLNADVGFSATSKIISKIGSLRFDKESSETEIKHKISQILTDILAPCETHIDLNQHKPEVILMVGVNGAGKTTTIGKLATQFKPKKISLIAADTFRAAAVEQIKIWAERNQIRCHSVPTGSDAASLCFEGLTEAIKQKDDIVFIDTAGRLQNKNGLMDELKKIIRVIQKVIPEAPHHIWLCLDATTGQNALDQVKTFKEAVKINGLIINKLDGSAKGGILLAIAEETKTPVLYIGVGESIDDLNIFKAQDFAQSLLGENND